MDAKMSIKEYEKLADDGDAEAQNYLGARYFKGDIVKEDKCRAAQYFYLAAQQGLAKAAFNLALCYDFGHGIEQNQEEAVVWYYEAAILGDTDAQYNLGLSYLNGEGVDKNESVAIYWLQKAADRGDERAKEVLQGIPNNLTVENSQEEIRQTNCREVRCLKTTT